MTRNSDKKIISSSALFYEVALHFGKGLFSKSELRDFIAQKFELSKDSARNRIGDFVQRLPLKVLSKDLYRLSEESIKDIFESVPTPTIVKSEPKPIKEKPIKSDKPDLKPIALEVLEHLNQVTNSKYKATDKNLAHIMARLSDGYSKDDCILVIDKKSKEWLGTPFEKFLRVSTLFAGKFDDYLNQKTEITGKVTQMASYNFEKYVKGE